MRGGGRVTIKATLRGPGRVSFGGAAFFWQGLFSVEWGGCAVCVEGWAMAILRRSKKERLNVLATDLQSREAFAWARRRWRTWECRDHEPPRSAAGLLRDILVHAMLKDRG